MATSIQQTKYARLSYTDEPATCECCGEVRTECTCEEEQFELESAFATELTNYREDLS
jgi:hypothetical protein